MQRRLFALSIAIVVLVACAPAEPTPTRLEGLIESIERGPGAGPITSFWLEHDGRRTQVFVRPDFDYGFDLDHLYEHVEQQDPVSVSLEKRDDKLYAVTIDDA